MHTSWRWLIFAAPARRAADSVEISAVAEGDFYQAGKNRQETDQGITGRLKAAIDLAASLPLKDGVVSMYVLQQPRGHRYTRDAAGRPASERSAAELPELSFDFTFHALKANGISDLEGSLTEKQAISGHKSISQTARYDRKTKIVPMVGGQQLFSARA
ncbi:TPA: hypothetical protein SLO59_001472 [Serratia marcescens]|nr:hypothetical protein [Serratia marcescens]HEJ7313866.1 hypothetical protein [Serratia marcescens]